MAASGRPWHILGKMSKRLLIGITFCLLGLVLGGLFFVDSYHEAYWSSPAVFIPVTLLGLVASLLGGFLLGGALASRRGYPGGELDRWLIRIGAMLLVLGLVLGVSAIGTALGVSSTGYWGHPPYNYEGDYAVMRFHIDMFRFAIVPLLAGGLLAGAALEMRKARR